MGEDVRTHVADARSFAARSSEQWDLIQIALVDSFSAAAAGVHALDESLLYTVEAFETFLDRLAPGGVLAVTRWLKLPPRDSLRLLWTARRALEARGVADPASHLVMIRGWKTTTLVIGARPFGEDTIAGLRRFAEDYAFDLVWHPGIGEGEANRHNRLAEPEFYRGASAILGPDPEGYAARYKFALTPATDDRPFFFHTLKWSTLPELLALRAQGGLPLIEWGFVILVATLVQAFVAAALLILAPLLALRAPRTTEARPPARWRVVLFFACLGLAFLFIEIAFMQRFRGVSRASALRHRGGARRPPGLRRPGCRRDRLACAPGRAQAAHRDRRGRDYRCRRRLCRALALRVRGGAGLADRRAPRGGARAARPHRLLPRDALPARAQGPRRPRARAGALGLGNQRLCFGGERVARDFHRAACRLHARARLCFGALCPGRGASRRRRRRPLDSKTHRRNRR